MYKKIQSKLGYFYHVIFSPVPLSQVAKPQDFSAASTTSLLN